MSVDYKLEELIEKITQSSSADTEPPLRQWWLVVHINPKATDQLRIAIPANTRTPIEFAPHDMGGQT